MKISIVTVCKNAEATLEKTILSVVSQSYKDIEYIVIDGASGDGTQAIIARYKSRIDTLVTESDSGVYNAMNKGLALCQGEIVYFLNAGEIFYRNDVIARVAAAFEQNQIDVLFGNVIIHDHGTERLERYPTVDQAFFLEKNLCHQAMFMTRTAFEVCGRFDECYLILADYDWNLKAFLNHRQQFGYVDFVIARYRRDGISSSKEARFKNIRRIEKRKIYEQHYNRLQLKAYHLFLKKMIKKLNRQELRPIQVFFTNCIKSLLGLKLGIKPINISI